MADIKISELLPASTPLDGTETLPIVQGGNTVKASTQDIASLYSIGYTPENVANKSTDFSFAGATDLKYPSQLAVKTYVDNTLGNAGWGLSGNAGTTSTNFIGTTDAQDFVLKSNNTERLKLNAGGGILSSTYINVSNGVNSSVVGPGYLTLYTTNGISQIQSDYVTGSKLLQLPNVNNKFLAVSVNGQPADASGNVTISTTLPYKVYSALITQNGVSGLTITELQNTLGPISSITYGTNPYYYYLFGSGLFTANKTMVIHGDSALSGGDKLVRIYRGTANTVEVYGYIAGIMDHTAIQSVSLEIRVYN